MTASENLIVLYVISFFQVIIESLVYPHLFHLLISFVGSAAVSFRVGWVVTRDAPVSAWRILGYILIFLSLLAPMRWAVFKIMGVQ